MFQPLKNLLKKRVRQYNYSDEILAGEVFNFWQKLMENEFGPEVSQKVRAFYFKEGVLKIKVSDSDLIRQLKQKEPLMIEKINRFLERNFISSQKLKRIKYEINEQ